MTPDNGEDSKPAAKKPDQMAKDLYEKVWKPMRQANVIVTTPTVEEGQDPNKEDPAPTEAKEVPEEITTTKPAPVPPAAKPTEEPPAQPFPLDSVFQELVLHPTVEQESESSDSSSSLSTNSF